MYSIKKKSKKEDLSSTIESTKRPYKPMETAKTGEIGPRIKGANLGEIGPRLEGAKVGGLGTKLEGANVGEVGPRLKGVELSVAATLKAAKKKKAEAQMPRGEVELGPTESRYLDRIKKRAK